MKKNREEKKLLNVPQLCYLFFCMITILAYMIEPAYANVTIWEKASEIMSDVYGEIVGISTIAAIVTAAIALLMMNLHLKKKQSLITTMLRFLGFQKG